MAKVFVALVVLSAVVLLAWRSRGPSPTLKAPPTAPAEPVQETPSAEPEEPEPAVPDGLENELYEGFKVTLAPSDGQVWRFDDLEAAAKAAGFRQADDFWAVPASDGDGADYVVWIEPQVEGKSVYHHAGPYSGLEVTYSALRHAPARAKTYTDALESLSQQLGGVAQYRGEELTPEAPTRLTEDIEAVIAAWRAVDVEPGSDQALLIDF